jgi:DNA-binding SARP family transcriptional activator
MDILWPDQDGGRAYQALATAVHRLRRLLNQPQAVLTGDGRISLNFQQCWSDAWAFERLFDAPTQSGEGAERAVSFYESHVSFRPDDDGILAPYRNHLRTKYVSAVVARGRELESQGRTTQALDCYQAGLERDDVHESLIGGLLRCCVALDRRSEGLAAYDAFRRRLQNDVGVAPGAAIESLADALRRPRPT